MCAKWGFTNKFKNGYNYCLPCSQAKHKYYSWIMAVLIQLSANRISEYKEECIQTIAK